VKEKSSSYKSVKPQTSKPVFVVGVFRSGTSLLYSLLNQHPKIALMFETDIWDFPEAFSKLRFRGNWLERQEFFNQTLSRHRLIFAGSLRGVKDTRTPEELYGIFGAGKDAGLVGEKSPFYCARLEQLAAQYPGCAFILLWRDPVEIYRSIVQAGRQEPFFNRRGMLSRQIHYQEQMIRQAEALQRSGARVYHLTYGDLIDKTEEVCRNLCQFLEIEFDREMMDLAHADFSAIYRAPQHEHLRRGIIERQKFGPNSMDEAVIQKLERYRTRWNRLTQGQRFPGVNGSVPEPSAIERGFQKLASWWFITWDSTKRALFEFLPLTWLQTYRQTMQWLFARHSGFSATRRSLREEWSEHWITILASFTVLGGLAVVHSLADPRFTFLPFYLVPCGILTLVINRRWGTVAAFLSSFIGPALLSQADPDFARYGVFFWNCAMRFLLLQIVVLLLDRVRVEMSSGGDGQHLE
jgi:sulfotransferase family protein